MIWTVSFAESSFTSAQSTFAPSRANRTAAAFPFPQPGPTDPAPTTSATFSCKRPTMAFSDLHKPFLALALICRSPHTDLVEVVRVLMWPNASVAAKIERGSHIAFYFRLNEVRGYTSPSHQKNVVMSLRSRTC